MGNEELIPANLDTMLNAKGSISSQGRDFIELIGVPQPPEQEPPRKSFDGFQIYSESGKLIHRYQGSFIPEK